MNNYPRLAATIVALSCAMLATAADSKTISYPPEAMCTAANATGTTASLREQIAQTPRGPIAYYRFGQGSPVVLVTGFRATLSEWDTSFVAELAKHHDVVVFDNRGVGRSQPDAASFSIDDMAQDTAALIDTLRVHHATVAGWSMGGAIVQQLAIDSPASMRKMVLMSAPAPGRFGTPVSPVVEAKLSGKPRATLHDIMGVLFPAGSVDDAQRCFKQDMYRPADYTSTSISAQVTEGQTTALRSWAADDKAGEALRSVRIDTLVLTGTDDAVVMKQNAEALKQLLPDAHLLMVRSAGHAMMYQYPVALARAIDSFTRQ
jgi:pimeloyl-ACP methyl ester carboxylesterase